MPRFDRDMMIRRRFRRQRSRSVWTTGMAEREGLCANYLPYPNLQAFRADGDTAGTNAGTIAGTNEKRKPPLDAIGTHGKLG